MRERERWIDREIEREREREGEREREREGALLSVQTARASETLEMRLSRSVFTEERFVQDSLRVRSGRYPFGTSASLLAFHGPALKTVFAFFGARCRPPLRHKLFLWFLSQVFRFELPARSFLFKDMLLRRQNLMILK